MWEGMWEVVEDLDVRRKHKKIMEVIRKAAEEATPNTVVRKDGACYETREIRQARRDRNNLRRDLTRRRTEWRDKSREVSRLEKEAKSRTWRDTVDGSQGLDRMWRLVKNLNGERTSKSGKAMKYRGRTCTTHKAKANAFIQEYAEFSGRRSTKETRRENVEVIRDMREREVGESVIEGEFTMEEFEVARKRIKNGKAGGADGLTSDYIKRLPRSAKEELLTIYIDFTTRAGDRAGFLKSGGKQKLSPFQRKGKIRIRWGAIDQLPLVAGV
jgi:hypothetical protein